jgi:type I restriction enzyme S subunit
VREARLGDVVASMKNGIYKPASEYADDGTPCLRMYNIEAGAIVWRDIKRMKVTPAERLDYGLLEGDLLVNRVNSRELVGKAAVIPAGMEPSVFESKNIRVRLDGAKALPKFINYQLFAGGSRHFANNAQQVVGMASISQGQLADFPIALTDLDEQRRIVAEIDKQFSRLDEAVANLQRVKANLKRYKAAVLKAAVEGRLVETESSIASREGRGYETGEQLLQRILEVRRSQWSGRGKYKEPVAPSVECRELPEGWVWSSMDQLAEVGTGATPNRSNAAFWTAGDVPWVSSAVVNGDQVSEASEFVTQRALAETNLTLYPPGTLLLAMYGEGKTRGKCAELRIPATMNQALAAIQTEDEIRSYLRHFLEHNYEEMRKVASGGVQPNLNLSLVRTVCIPLPPLSEQTRISAEVDRHLSILRGVEAEIDANLQRAQALRQSILAKAFSPASSTEGLTA